MIGWLGDAYPWVKALHVIFVIFWIAGLFMLPRFLVYHYPVPPHSAEDALWIERERRLLRIIINPTMILTWVLGLMLAFNLGWGDRKSVVWGRRVSVRVDLGGRRIIKKKKNNN